MLFAIPPTHRRTTILLVVLIGMFTQKLHAQLPVITLRSLSQSFFSPGGEYEIGIAEGTQIEEVVDLIVAHPGIRADLLTDTTKPLSSQLHPGNSNFRLKIADDVKLGRYEIRAVGRFGVSNPRAILVVDQSRVVTGAPHNTQSAAKLTTSVLHHRCVAATARDYYTLSVAAGETYNLQLIGHSIDSRLIPVVSVVNSQGRTVHSKIGSDQSNLTFSFVAETTETLRLVVHDALFRGGASFQYGVRVTAGDPPADLERAMPPRAITADRASDDKLQKITINDDGSTPLKVPFQIAAEFDAESHRRHFLCSLTKGLPVQIDVLSDRYGEPTDVRLVVEQSNGEGDARTWQRIATSEDSYNISDSVIRLGTADPVLRFQPPADGDYRITVIDLDTGGSLSDTKRFWLSVSKPKSDWQLLAYRVYPHKDANTSRPSGTHLIHNGGIVLRVFAIRENMAEPIRVIVPDLPVGLSCRPAWIASNQNHVDLVITASTDAKAGVMSCRVIGETHNASPGDQREARYATVVWEQDGHRPFIQTRVTDKLLAAVSDQDSYPVTIRIGDDNPIVTKKGSKVTLPVKLLRNEGGKQNVVLRARNLPASVKAADLTIPAGKSEAQWTVEVSPTATPGKYSLWGQGETIVKFSLNPQALTRLTKYLEELKVARADPKHAAKHVEIDKLIAETQKQVEAVKKQAAPRDFTVYVPSPLITLEIQ